MTADTVYTIAKALPEMEYMRLYELFARDLDLNRPQKILKKRQPVLTNVAAIEYLLKNMFSEEAINRNSRNLRKATTITKVTNI